MTSAHVIGVLDLTFRDIKEESGKLWNWKVVASLIIGEEH
jgi:hypothetical protein